MVNDKLLVGKTYFMMDKNLFRAVVSLKRIRAPEFYTSDKNNQATFQYLIHHAGIRFQNNYETGLDISILYFLSRSEILIES